LLSADTRQILVHSHTEYKVSAIDDNHAILAHAFCTNSEASDSCHSLNVSAS